MEWCENPTLYTNWFLAQGNQNSIKKISKKSAKNFNNIPMHIPTKEPVWIIGILLLWNFIWNLFGSSGCFILGIHLKPVWIIRMFHSWDPLEICLYYQNVSFLGSIWNLFVPSEWLHSWDQLTAFAIPASPFSELTETTEGVMCAGEPTETSKVKSLLCIWVFLQISSPMFPTAIIKPTWMDMKMI